MTTSRTSPSWREPYVDETVETSNDANIRTIAQAAGTRLRIEQV